MQNIIWTLLLFILILPSCSSDKQTGQVRNASGTNEIAALPGPSASPAIDRYTLEISPKKVIRDSTVNLIVTGFDVRDARIEWLINGAISESANPTQFRLSDARKGDTLQARAFIRGREILSNEVEIGNSLPEISSVRILPEIIKPGDALSVAAEGNDADGDSVTMLYEWTVNGSPAGNKEKIESPVKRGDKVCIRITPCDPEGRGRVFVMNREIQNNPPVIQEHRDFNFDGTVYTYQVKAYDPDEDALAYSLEEAPAGMSIDKSAGLITWKVPAEFKGDAGATAVVQDGNGGIARYSLKISIK
jgi:hypothetical protein